MSVLVIIPHFDGLDHLQRPLDAVAVHDNLNRLPCRDGCLNLLNCLVVHGDRLRIIIDCQLDCDCVGGFSRERYIRRRPVVGDLLRRVDIDNRPSEDAERGRLSVPRATCCCGFEVSLLRVTARRLPWMDILGIGDLYPLTPVTRSVIDGLESARRCC